MLLLRKPAGSQAFLPAGFVFYFFIRTGKMAYRDCGGKDIGRFVEVSDGGESSWVSRKLIAIANGREFPYIVELDNNENYVAAYKQARSFIRPVDERDIGAVGLLLGATDYEYAKLLDVFCDKESQKKYAIYKLCDCCFMRPVETVSLLHGVNKDGENR